MQQSYHIRNDIVCLDLPPYGFLYHAFIVPHPLHNFIVGFVIGNRGYILKI